MSDARSRPSGWWWVLALGIVVGLVGGFLVGNKLSSTVTSTSQLVVQGVLTDGAPDPADAVLTSNQYVNQRMLTYPGIATSDRVITPAAEQLGLAPAEIAGTITATAVTDSSILDVAVTGSSPEEAQRRAEAVTNAIIGAIEGLENPPPPAPARVDLQVISPAGLPDPPPIGPALAAVIGALLGGLIGAVSMVRLANSHRATQRRRDTYQDSFPERADLSPRTNGTAAAPPRRPAPPTAPVRPADPTGRRVEPGRERS